MPAELAPVLARATGTSDIVALEGRLREAQREVRRIFEAAICASSARPYARRRAA
jgi:hypothetical protein